MSDECPTCGAPASYTPVYGSSGRDISGEWNYVAPGGASAACAPSPAAIEAGVRAMFTGPSEGENDDLIYRILKAGYDVQFG